jgi:hypothetical protein
MLNATIGDRIGSVYEHDVIKTKDFPLFGKDVAFTDCTVAFLPGNGSGNPVRCSGTTTPVAEAFSYRPGYCGPLPVNDRGRRFAAPGHGDVRDALRHGLLMYYSVFVTLGFTLIWHGSRGDPPIGCLSDGHSHGHPAGSPDRPFWQRRSEERGSARIAVHRRSGATTRRTIHSCRLPSHPSSCCRKCVTEPIRGQAR